MELDARSVIAPCSEILLRSDLSPQQRGMAFFVRGRGYHRSGQIALAGTDYDQALRLIPNDDELWISRSNVFFRLGDYAEGIKALEWAYKLNPKNARIYFVMGHMAMRSGKSAQARGFFSHALSLDPAEPYSLLFRARLSFSAREFDAAFKDIDALIGLKPEVINRLGYLDEDGRMRDFHIVALAKRADMFEKTAKYERAEQDLDAAVAYKRSAESLTARGEFLLARPQRTEAALADLEEATRLDSTYRVAFYTKGLVLVRLKRFEEAFAAFDRAVLIAPDDEYALRMRGRMHRALGRPEAAAEDLAAAMTMSPQLMRQTIPALRHAGYWTSLDPPREMTQELRDAIQACMIDPHCN